MTTIDVLDILVTVGPVFAFSRLIGLERTVRVEQWLLMRWSRSWLLARAFIQTSIPLTSLLFTLSIGSVLFASANWIVIMGAASASLPVFLILAAVMYYGSFRLYTWTIHNTHNTVCNIADQWRTEYASPPPWPIYHLAGEIHYQRLFVFQYALVLWVIYFAILHPIFWVTCGLVLLPFWCTEQLRAKLNPTATNYLDTLVYCLAIGAAAIKITRIFIQG